jgi:hypothetical protein
VIIDVLSGNAAWRAWFGAALADAVGEAGFPLSRE